MVLLQERARALMLARDFGAEAIELNRQLVAADPSDTASRTRLARCLLESGRLEEAEAEYREVLRLDPKSRIAAGGLEAAEQKRRLAAMPLEEPPPTRTPRARRAAAGVVGAGAAHPPSSTAAGEPVPQFFSGFSGRDFTELALCRGTELRERFSPRVVDLLRRVNALGSSQEIAAVREAGRRQLFRLGRADVHVRPRQWHVFNMGGRWEPRFDIGMSGGDSWEADWLRVGMGFNLAAEGTDPARADGVREVRERFRKFQSVLGSPRRSLFLGWMIKENGLVQHDRGGPRTDLPDPSQAADLLQRADPERTDWVFFGKWLSPHREDDSAVLADPVALVRTVDRVFNGLLPLWRALWE